MCVCVCELAHSQTWVYLSITGQLISNYMSVFICSNSIYANMRFVHILTNSYPGQVLSKTNEMVLPMLQEQSFLTQEMSV